MFSYYLKDFHLLSIPLLAGSVFDTCVQIWKQKLKFNRKLTFNCFRPQIGRIFATRLLRESVNMENGFCLFFLFSRLRESVIIVKSFFFFKIVKTATKPMTTIFLDALFLCQAWIKGRKADDEINGQFMHLQLL